MNSCTCTSPITDLRFDVWRIDRGVAANSSGIASGGADDRADADLAVAEQVHPQAALVDQRAQRPGLARLAGQALEVRARLAEALAEARDVADAKALPDERVEVDAAGHHVPARLLGGEALARERQRVEHLGLDQGEVVAAAVGVRERPAAVEVAVALQAAADVRGGALDPDHRP